MMLLDDHKFIYNSFPYLLFTPTSQHTTTK